MINSGIRGFQPRRSRPEGSVLAAPPPGRSGSNSGFLGSAPPIFNWSARDPGGGKKVNPPCNWLAGWSAADSPSPAPSSPIWLPPSLHASTTCSHSTPPSSDKASSLQIETNDLPPRSQSHCPTVCVLEWSARQRAPLSRAEGIEAAKQRLSAAGRKALRLGDYSIFSLRTATCGCLVDEKQGTLECKCIFFF